MASVDFSHATIELKSTVVWNDNYRVYLCLNDGTLRNSAKNTIVSNQASTVVSDNLNGFKILYSGKFTEAGTEFYIGTNWGGDVLAWKVSNVSFSAGDTYSFTVTTHITT